MALFFDPFSGFDFFSFVVPIFFGITLLIIFGMLGYRLVEGLKNSLASEETVQATLIDKVTSYESFDGLKWDEFFVDQLYIDV